MFPKRLVPALVLPKRDGVVAAVPVAAGCVCPNTSTKISKVRNCKKKKGGAYDWLSRLAADSVVAALQTDLLFLHQRDWLVVPVVAVAVAY